MPLLDPAWDQAADAVGQKSLQVERLPEHAHQRVEVTCSSLRYRYKPGPVRRSTPLTRTPAVPTASCSRQWLVSLGDGLVSCFERCRGKSTGYRLLVDSQDVLDQPKRL